MNQDNVFIYQWHIDDKEQEVTSIRIYGINENNKNICLRVNNFTPFVYIELPEYIQWNESKAQMLCNKLDQILDLNKPLIKSLSFRKKLYGAHFDVNGKTKRFPYLFCAFSTKNDIVQLGYKLRRNIQVSGLGMLKLKMHESNADPVLQLICSIDIPSAGWVTFRGKEVEEYDKVTLCDKEYIVSYKNIVKLDRNTVALPKIMGFDIEVNSTNPSAMPNAQKPGDKVFQISCVITREGNFDDYIPYLLSLGDPNPEIVGENVIIQKFDTEADLLEGFTNLIRIENPNVIVGYNIFGFDIPYMIDRAKHNMCIFNFDKQGFHKYNHAKEKIIKWSSNAYKNQEFQFLDAEGRLFVDLLPLVRRDYKMDNYKLKTISTYFIGETKDPLSVKGIFKCYRIGIKKNDDGEYGPRARKALGIVGKYCVQDSVLVVKLMDKLQTWVGLCEMAKTCNVGIFSLYTQGQQIKVYSQVYRYSMYNNITVEQDVYETKEDERYMGAHVFDPIPGVYDRVLPFDFCFTGNTLISMSNGCSKRIDNLTNDEFLLGYKDEGLSNFTTINGLQNKGIKETIKVFFQDGTILTCTPEHRIMDETGKWIEAQHSKDKYIMRGIEYTEDTICSLEKDWTLNIDGYIFNMTNERENILAFSRMLGYILSDGSIYITNDSRSILGYRKFVEVYMGTMIDAINFKLDIKKFSNVDVKIRYTNYKPNTERSRKGSTYCITLPSKLTKMIHSINNIVIGKRSTQPMRIPEFILHSNCPLSVIREFLGGLYGGDGTAPYYVSKNDFGPISFKWTTIENHIDSMVETFNNLAYLHNKLGINVTIHEPYLVKYKKESIIPSDIEKNPRYDVQLNLFKDHSYLFLKQIGFRYCINKSCRLSVVASYQNMFNKTREQHSRVVNRTNELIDTTIKNVFSRKKGNPTFTTCLEKARNELLDDEPAYSLYSLSSVYDIGYQRHEAIRHSNRPRKISLQSKKFQKPKEYIQEIGVEQWFSFSNKKVYAVNGNNLTIPCFKQKVIDIRYNGSEQVYDIEVNDAHNFVANGVVVHNCSLYPTTIIAYNIDYSTIVSDDDPISNNLCNVMEWDEHLSCSHDPKIIRKTQLTEYINKEKEKITELRAKRDKTLDKLRKKEINDEIANLNLLLKPYTEERSSIDKSKSKFPMCAKRYYRFVKEPRGVIPTILQNLLDARKNTRQEIKQHKDEIKITEDENEIKKLKDLNNVLDKRQLSYKISANSVSATTPILCEFNGLIVYKTIEELSQGNWVRINEDQEVSSPIIGIKVWSDKGFTTPKFVMRHPQEQPLKRIITHVGMVDCTEDHSLLSPLGQEVKPSELEIGDELMHYQYPLPDDTPIVPLYDTLTDHVIQNHVLNGEQEEKAFVDGLFFAEGTCGNWGILGKEKSSWIIFNQHYTLLERACYILNKHILDKNLTFIISPYYKSARVYHLVARGNVKQIVSKYRQEFYDNRGYKKVPDYILNSSYNVRQSFFIGYYAGDGARKIKKGIIINNKGQRGTASLMYLANSLGYKVSISNCKNNLIFRLQCSSNFRIKNITKIKSIEISPKEDQIKLLKKPIIYNNELIEFDGSQTFYRNIQILCNRFPRHKLFNSLDNAINIASNRNAYIIKYQTNNKKITYVKYCCKRQYNISIRCLNLNLIDINNCNCNQNEENKTYNNYKIYKIKEPIEYVYDIETENHHFAAGIGHMIVHNSMYGAMGVKKGYLPFMPGAMATTYMGRKSIELVAKVIPERFGGQLVYGK